MNQTLNDLKTRRSIRKYKTDPIPKELLDQVLEAGTYAPTGMNRQTPVIIAITNPDMVKKVSQLNAAVMGGSNDPFYGAPAVLVVLAEKTGTWIYDGSLVMGNLMLAADSLGIGSCWIHRAKETFEMPEWQDWLRSLGVEEAYEGIANCVLGYADIEPKTPPRKDGRVIRED